MVSYFVPRGRFLLKAGNLRQVVQQQHQPTQLQLLTTKGPQPQAQNASLPTARHFRQFATNSAKDAQLHHRRPHKQPPNSGQELVQLRRNLISRWTSFLLRWAPMGICVFGAIEWQLQKQRCDRSGQPRTASELQSRIYCSLPLRIISRCWGWLAACYLPPSLRPYVYGWYSNTYNVNLSEALYPEYEHYNSLAEFFTRPLREGVRPIDKHAPLVSPADGKVLHFGSASDSLIEQVKGVSYSIEDFLGPLQTVEEAKSGVSYAEALKKKSDESTELYQCVIYLAPGDYHRFHSPAAWEPTIRRHFSGELLSVSPKVAGWLPGLFCLNERVLYMGQWRHGFFSYTAVGATNVGSVEIFIDADLKTNRWNGLKVGKHPRSTYEYDELVLDKEPKTAPKFDKGDLVGQFNMGSTIVLLFEAPKNFKFDIVAGQKIRVGESLGHIAGSK
ncbi:phosphatidylserine decarboxylase proenzyme, mitochondrial [Drosophila ficusphila]|uniref:phosphatidylserine decarboxylase proenzyme, mitochondrial n=1 Tax=Drosophila ficusphila TaxID=30025 RepID=UPI0007E8A24D|nr:phosphatidylserine decarboxylase proenzyme, mitochondrial [Drosophila ficusphila]XP_017046912.1 phosphatidylserine decarboxylase proenzyme, mitochondrial [Drosophila ficusphila]